MEQTDGERDFQSTDLDLDLQFPIPRQTTVYRIKLLSTESNKFLQDHSDKLQPKKANYSLQNQNTAYTIKIQSTESNYSLQNQTTAYRIKLQSTESKNCLRKLQVIVSN